MCNKFLGVDFYIQTCIYAGCGIHFGVPERWDKERHRDHAAMYCPNGHVQFYTKKTKEQKLREQLKVARNDHEQCVVRLTETIEEKDSRIKSLKRSRGQYKGRLEKLTAKPEEEVAPTP